MKDLINATGSYLPEKVLSNQDLEAMVETTDEWIVSRTGMRERRIAREDEAASDMGIEAAKAALKQAGLSPEKIDLILVATSTPDHLMPSTAAIIQQEIGAKNCGAFDLEAACTGYLYALATAKAFIESKLAKHVLVVATEKISSYIDYQDRSTCVLFGDGAAASLLSDEGPGLEIESIELGSDGSCKDLIIIPAGGSRIPPSQKSVAARLHYFKMEGREVFRHAVRRMEKALDSCLEKSGVSASQIRNLVPHQANDRILEALAKRLDMPIERVCRTVHKYGNTSAASCPITLDELLRTQTIAQGERLMLVAFGAGLTWGAALLKQV
jgi:3-oxoacyl-[acyl-carrier-protein] synthase-3